MAEAPPTTISNSTICSTCELKLDDESQLANHIEEVHNDGTELNNKAGAYSKRQKLFTPSAGSVTQFPLCNNMKMLKSILRENFAVYLNKLQLWIKSDITRREFDQGIRPLFTPETIKVHNEFLISFLKEIRSISRVCRQNRKKCNFAMQMDLYSTESSRTVTGSVESHAVSTQCIDISSQSNFVCPTGMHVMAGQNSLPDRETMYALAIVNAWENVCPAVNTNVVPLLSNTVKNEELDLKEKSERLEKIKQTLVQNVFAAIKVRRKKLKIREDGLVYDISAEDPKDINPNDKFKYTGDVTLPELLDVLEAEPQLIPMRNIYNSTVQRIISLMKKKENPPQEPDTNKEA